MQIYSIYTHTTNAHMCTADPHTNYITYKHMHTHTCSSPETQQLFARTQSGRKMKNHT